jgi:cytoskeletal protein RodZ
MTTQDPDRTTFTKRRVVLLFLIVLLALAASGIAGVWNGADTSPQDQKVGGLTETPTTIAAPTTDGSAQTVTATVTPAGGEQSGDSTGSSTPTVTPTPTPEPTPEAETGKDRFWQSDDWTGPADEDESGTVAIGGTGQADASGTNQRPKGGAAPTTAEPNPE